MNHVIGTAMRNTKSSTGDKSQNAQSPVSTAANIPVQTVAKWFPKYPIII
ncbi:hypothetical protein NADRNF5_0132 [Nitrosopumilus adriaticus]|uniref:Uncharacterized protein n=1 Tax=Nitrosopumilus adriaticus TaxID=1580092 RepID=A0A0D5BZG6_9ARCH|nr:hypothetical protein NADRNF5_0132 [Nitrosopumilus adriaticus]